MVLVATVVAVVGLMIVVGQLSQPTRWVYFPPVVYEYGGEAHIIVGWWFDVQIAKDLSSTEPIAEESAWRAQMHPFGH